MPIDSQTQMEMLQRAATAAGFGGASAGEETPAPITAATPTPEDLVRHGFAPR